jgi:hypothetical protein
MYESRWAAFLPLKLCAEVMVMGDETIVDGMVREAAGVLK